MPLSAGERLGPYEIVSALGAGGMGEVYRARDTKLGRDVALKILPEAFALDPDRLARFRREAQILASFNHPHIAHIYGLEGRYGPDGQESGPPALVMELVDGPTLADRIAQGPIPVDEALTLAKQIAEALEVAHEQGIIHRDLKPGNIMLRADGTATVLDFGLAKALEPVGNGLGTSSALSQSPTITTPAMTQAGVILGTAAYMSPEQAKGRPVDRRSDLWAFGCVLYEMLTGKRAFDGEDMVDVLSAVARLEPDWQRLPRETPERIRVLLQRCLKKDRTLRLQAAGDARVEVQEALSGPTLEHTEHSRSLAKYTRAGFLSRAGSLLLGAIIAGATVWTLKGTPPGSVAHVVVPLPAGERLATLVTSVLALSPDGSRVAFIAGESGRQQIYVRAFDNAQATAVPGTSGADEIAFSPDGRWLAFSGGGRLMRVALGGGAPLTICSAISTRGFSWGDNDTIVFAAGFGTDGLSIVPAEGGKPSTVTSMLNNSESPEEAHRWPQLLPGSKAVLYTAWTRNLDDAQIIVQRLDSNERRVVLSGGTYARYVPTGHLVYARAGTLLAVRFDLSRLEVIGDPVSLGEGVLLTAEGAVQVDIATNGTFAHVPGGLQGSGRQLTWVDRSGKEEALGAPPRAYMNPRLSPDGRQIAVVVQGVNDDIWTYDIPRQTLTRLTFESRSLSPVWTADGQRIIYRSTRNGILNLFGKAADGSGPEERLTMSDDNQTPQDVSPDGRLLAFHAGRDLWILPLVGEKAARVFLQTPFLEGDGAFSPDSRWLAYRSDESGRSEVYIQPFPAGGRKVQISRNGGFEPRWARSGELFYLSATAMMSVRVGTGDTLAIGNPEALFERTQYVVQGNSSFDVTPDATRVLMIKEAAQAGSVTQINVVFNWTEELKRLVPVD